MGWLLLFVGVTVLIVMIRANGSSGRSKPPNPTTTYPTSSSYTTVTTTEAVGDRAAATGLRDARFRTRNGERPSKPTGTAAGYAASLSNLGTAVERPASSWLAISTRPPATSFPNRAAVATLLRTSNSPTWPVPAGAVRAPGFHD